MTRRHRTKRRRHQEGGRASKVVFLTLGVFLAAAGIGALALVGYIISIANSAPDINTLKPVDKGAVSSVYAANGSRLGFIGSDELRTPIEGRQIPKIIKQATVAIEDRRYYQHGGVDYPGIVRAGIDNLRAGKTVQGGSTITMQLVRNLAYVSTERTYQRKIKEAKLADELESERSKSWILDTYLNSVPYGTVAGRSAIGIEAASRMFFDKPARKLKLREAALLTVAEGERLKDSKLGVKPNDYYTRKKENYFFDYVQQELIDRYGANTVRRGGLKVYTTIDLDLQKEARTAMFGRLGEPSDPRSAIVSVDPSNGYIRAMASSADYRKNKYNLAAQGKRQPGSTFKVMVLMTALRKGIDPQSTTYVSKPLSINDPRYGPWNVKTYSGGYAGPLNLVQATLQSDNTVYAQLDLDVGPDAVKETARMMGITSKLNGYPAEGLGGLEDGVSPLEMASAYATIANGGWRIRPTAIRKVVFPDGKVKNLGKVRRKKVFTDGVTAEATNILEQNVQKGTGTAANIGCPAAGKTGTTDNYTDAWFVGFTPKLASATWVGYPQSTQIRMDNVKGVTVAGGTYPAEIWGDYMRMAKGGFCGDFSAPQTSFTGSPGNQAKPSDEQSGGQNGGGGGGGNGGYDPGLYDTPPQ
jgi:penicillin-binding protein 1A